jgi:hypothetical protein
MIRILIILVLCLTAQTACADDMLTPLPDTVKYSCSAAYVKVADAYWPVVGDILRFNAMFQNYATLCAKAAPAQMKAIQPFAETMKARAKNDVDDSYSVMDRLIHTTLRPQVPQPCQHDRAAQDAAVHQFQQEMDALAQKAKDRLTRSGRDIGPAQSGAVCQNLSTIKTEVETGTMGRDLSNPLFELAFLRGMVASSDVATRTVYTSYRDTLGQVQRDHGKPH